MCGFRPSEGFAGDSTVIATLAHCKKDLRMPQSGPVPVTSEILRPNEDAIAEVEHRITALLAPAAQS
jgi:hypothetical protein